jgi:hypothetical protein
VPNNRSHKPEFSKGDNASRPQNLEEARRLLQEWANEPQKWTYAKKRNAMNLLFQICDSHPFAVNPAPILERWQRESGNSTNENEAADVYRKFRSHGNPIVASIVLTTRLQFVNTAKDVVEAAQELLNRHPDNVLLYGNVLQRLAQLDGDDESATGDLMRQFVHNMVQQGVPINVVCFNILLRYFTKQVDVVYELIGLMKSCQILPDYESYTQLVHTYIYAHKPEAAVRALLQIDKASNLAESSLHVLKYYRGIVTRPASSFATKREAVNAATALYEHVLPRLSSGSKGSFLLLFLSSSCRFSLQAWLLLSCDFCYLLKRFFWNRPTAGRVDGHVCAHWRHGTGQGSIQYD